MRLAIFSAIFALSLSVSCDELNNDGSSNDSLSVDVSYGGLAFTATADYLSSTFYYYDFDSGGIKTLSSGEAGDALPLYANSKLYLFNRSADSQNFRDFDPALETQTSKQLSFPGVPGDPSDAYGLGDGKILLADHVSGALVIIDETGAEVERIDAEWDLPEGATIKPVKFREHTTLYGTYILVVSQGYDASYKADGAQRLFVLEKLSGSWVAKDLDANAAGVQGVELTASCPDTFLDKTDTAVVVMGTCSSFMVDCKAGFDLIDLTTWSVAQLWDFTGEGHYMSGGSSGGDSVGEVYTAVSEVTGTNKRVVSVNYLNKTVSDAYVLKGENVASIQVFNDKETKTLIVSDAKDAETGMLVVIKDGAEQTLSVEHPNITTGLLVPKEEE